MFDENDLKKYLKFKNNSIKILSKNKRKKKTIEKSGTGPTSKETFAARHVYIVKKTKIYFY